MKLKISNCDKTQKLKLWWNSIFFYETQKPKLWWNSKTQIVRKLKNLKCDKTQIVTKLKITKYDKTQIVTKL